MTVTESNDTPEAVDDARQVSEDTAVIIAVLANDTDEDGDTLSVTSVGTPAHGTAAVGANGTVVYTPAANYNGPTASATRSATAAAARPRRR